jgi:hypothetical protein
MRILTTPADEQDLLAGSVLTWSLQRESLFMVGFFVRVEASLWQPGSDVPATLRREFTKSTSR